MLLKCDPQVQDASNKRTFWSGSSLIIAWTARHKEMFCEFDQEVKAECDKTDI